MPWSVGDVEKHKEGLSQEEKKRWVKVANSVLSDCKDNNGSNCEAKAIRIANSKVSGDSENG